MTTIEKFVFVFVVIIISFCFVGAGFTAYKCFPYLLKPVGDAPLLCVQGRSGILFNVGNSK